MTLYEQMKAEERVPVSGWDFSHLDGRWESDALPWDYAAVVNGLRRDDMRLLDMGTGGGEFLMTLGHPFGNTAVTEGYAPNAELCRRRLAPLGVTVVECDGGGTLPFADGAFDIVINRHESFCERELARTVKSGGFFVTQQVGGDNNRVLAARLIKNSKPPFPRHTLKNVSESLEQSGFEILFSGECFPRLRFFDIGAVVWFARVIEWEFPNFSVDGCYEQLVGLAREIDANGYTESVEHRFVIAARRR